MFQPPHLHLIQTIKEMTYYILRVKNKSTTSLSILVFHPHALSLTGSIWQTAVFIAGTVVI